MSETSPQQSGFDLSSLFGLRGIGDMGAAFSLFSRALRGEEITADQIPPGLQRQALHMAMTQVGVNPAGENAIEAFLRNETVIERVREAIQADLVNNIDTPQDTILFQAIDDMSGEELQALLVSNPDIKSMITESQDFQDMLIERVSGTTVSEILAESDVPTEGLNAAFLGRNLDELSVEDLTNLTRAELDILVPALPQDLFNTSFVAVINEHLPRNQRIQAPAEDSYEARQQAYQAARGNLIENGPGGFTGLFNLETRFYDNISNALNQDTVTQLQSLAQQQVSTQIENLDFEEMEPEDVRIFFDENRDMIAAQLTNQENWSRIETAINADLLIQNQQRILDAMLPEMTEEGLSAFQQGLNNLPPQIRELLMSVVNFATEMLGRIGIDLGGLSAPPAPEATPPQHDEVDPNTTAVLTGPGQ